MSMTEDLSNYNLQLQQVEAALLTDPANEELLKLKTDLEEVIALTQDLIKTQESETKVTDVHRSSNDDDVTASLLAVEEDVAAESYSSKYRNGEKCLAKWKADGQFYEAVIEEISDDHVKVKFEGYTTLETVPLDDVKKLGAGAKRPAADDKQGKGHNRDYLKKKKQKKQQRFKQIEEERESEKNKWLSFHTKSIKKPGVKAKSIFASPDNLNGRVGIGTCGISGKPMTDYTPGEKWKKGG